MLALSIYLLIATPMLPFPGCGTLTASWLDDDTPEGTRESCLAQDLRASAAPLGSRTDLRLAHLLPPMGEG
ncbi:hypothetical protein [Ktedonospora formicarum]|uniref:hypothetical protein n=1 Tax=Ktedonospora formicarum TaxID=2778364 RepID=UPI001C693E58|nr:hypothetical protein [Ktedonospora formicarum]